ncbi:uncharacterized protein SAPINGB_P004497 [Magnusiomyces paraingens]|uniref:Uncharacterized protein n=1 Tax=Magnusiomyces paraingens TaxID=2606893 RepID=A0A5E8BZW0_9ASCO|nr:uncharacterized protein SAPINGB_P004497 [Saprochaete ingens]VVT55240.1 unnamed protein product [Saprochaete ingens]
MPPARFTRTPRLLRLALVTLAVIALLFYIGSSSASSASSHLAPLTRPIIGSDGSTIFSFASKQPPSGSSAQGQHSPKVFSIDVKTSPPMDAPEQVVFAPTVYSYTGQTPDAEEDEKNFGIFAPMYALVSYAQGWPLVTKWFGGAANPQTAGGPWFHPNPVPAGGDPSTPRIPDKVPIVEAAPEVNHLKRIGVGSSINGRIYYTPEDPHTGANGRFFEEKRQKLRRQKGYHAIWGDGVMRRQTEEKHKDSLEEADYNGSKKTKFTPDDKIFSALDDTIDWSRFAYVQYVTDANYLCNALMAFEQLHKLNVRADKLLIYPSTWDNATFFEGNFSKDALAEDSILAEALPFSKYIESMLKSAVVNYGVSLQPLSLAPVISKPRNYIQSYAKYSMFNQTKYDRLLYIDPDGSIKRSLDHLFLLPRTTIAAPRAYWATEKSRLPQFTSKEESAAALTQSYGYYLLDPQIELLEPSNNVHAYIEKVLDSELAQTALKNEKAYEILLFNLIFKDEAMMLSPKGLTLPTSELRNKDLTHHQYLNLQETWNLNRILNETAYINFADETFPKPWVKPTGKEIRQSLPKCSLRSIVCLEQETWLNLYRDYELRRLTVCNMPLMMLNTTTGKYGLVPPIYSRGEEQRQAEIKRREEEQRKKKEEEEKKKKEEEEKKKKAEEDKKKAEEDKKKAEEDKKKAEEEEKKKAEEDKKKAEEDKKKAEEEEKKKKAEEEEKKKKAEEEEKKKKAEEEEKKKKAEEEENKKKVEEEEKKKKEEEEKKKSETGNTN